MTRSSLGFSLALLACCQPGAATELTGVVIRIQETAGQEAVRLAGPVRRRDPAPTLYQTISRGTVVKVPAGATVQVVCSTPALVRIEGPESWRLEPRTCGRGRPLSQADYALVAPRGGRFQYSRGLWLFKRVQRGDREDPLAPVLLSPRNTEIRTSQPTVSWLRVPAATEYRVYWKGRGSYEAAVDLRAEEAACSVRSDGLDVCELRWSADLQPLPPGRSFLLSVAARRDVVDDWHAAEEANKVDTVTEEKAKAVETALSALEGLGLEGAALEMARAGVLAEAGLASEAIEHGRLAVDLAPEEAPLAVTLADLSLSVGLDDIAEALYRQIRDDAEPAVRAAAVLGMGLVEYDRGRDQEAIVLFRRAAGLYDERLFPEEKATALNGARRAEERLAAANPARKKP